MTANETASDPVHTAETLYNDVIGLVAADPEDKRLLETQIHGATHLISLYARAQHFDKAQSRFDEITNILSTHPDPDFRESKASAAVALSAEYGNAGFVEKVRALYNEIKSMAEQFPDEAVLRNYQANIAVNMSIDYLREAQTDEVAAIHEEISALAEKYPEQMSIQRDRIRILANRIFYLTEETDDLKTARELYRQLAAFSQAQPQEPYLRRLQADGAVAIIAKIDALEEKEK
jgi:hypothetical protein